MMPRLLLVAFMCISASACTAPLPENTIPLNRGIYAPSTPQSIDVLNVSKHSGLQAGDQIQMMIEGEDELSGLYEVEEDGIVLMPLIDEVEIAGLTIDDAQAMIIELYQDGYLVAPQITIEIVSKAL